MVIILKKRVIFLVFAVILSISSVTAINSYAAKKEAEIERSQPLVLKEYENCVALYKGEKVIEVFNTVNFNSLPEYDQNQLKNGIVFQDIESVYSVIEDFDG